MATLLLFKIGPDMYHVEIPEISADRNIPQTVLNQFDAYVWGETKVGHFVELHKVEYAYKVHRTTKIHYRDFDRAVQHMTSNVADFFKTL